ncbi:YbhB/YbcL family Raf kinase inhibitor-like protein [Zestomonas thermotolerans]|uniref:YbhB/YbcL family Raf kinase inhibitor-like protein n=1 Tax=Zestomonas thermotolerans TaxID=157784 RepID=UPI0004884A1F|nr:YbhB/YbcL family Raf kinase inhibitor-like protein [Pseudomonas thermotolerans]
MKRHLHALGGTLLAALVSTAQAADFSLSSPTFQADQPLPNLHVFNGFGCSGENRSPALEWQNPPEGTKSFAVTLYDPDAPTGSGWWHWVVYNIPGDVQGLPEGAGSADGQGLPAGAVQGRTDFGGPGFGGACPPVGAPAHRYIMTVHALKLEQLPVPADASPAMIGYMIHMNRLGSATLQANYSR